MFLGVDTELVVFDVGIVPSHFNQFCKFRFPSHISVPVVTYQRGLCGSAYSLRTFCHSVCSGISYKADIGPVMTGSHDMTGNSLERGIKIAICF